MGVDVTVEIEIERPVDVVAGYAGDPANAPDWYRRISTATWETEPRVEIGARIVFEARFLGRDLRYTYEIVELMPGERLHMETTAGPFPMRTEYSWESRKPDRTRMTLRNHGSPSGFATTAVPLMSVSMKRAMRGDLAELKRILETR